MQAGRGSKRGVGGAAALAVGAAAVLAPAAAWPCLNGTILQTDDAAKLVAAAERDLAAGRPRSALARLHGGPSVQCRQKLELDSCRVDGAGFYELSTGARFLRMESAPLARRWALLTAIA